MDGALDNRQLISDLQRQLVRYAPNSFNVFVRDDKAGGRYSIERDTGFSAINTATLLRFQRDHPRKISALNRGEAEKNLRDHLAAALTEMAKHTDRPDLAEYDAYRAAQILRAIDDATAQQALAAWLRSSVEQWITQKGSYEPSAYVLYLAIEAIGRDTATKGMLPTALELLLLRQITLANEANGYFDAVDLALLLSMIEPTQLDRAQMNAALNALRQAAVSRSIWTNRKPVLRIGLKTLGCSAFEACIALLQAEDGRAFPALLPAFIAHMRSIESYGGPWFRSDLLRNERLHETWFNCRVLEFLDRLERRADDALRLELFSRYRARVVQTSFKWDKMILADADRDALQKGIIDPARAAASDKLEQCTAILFGPPGTTKTTTAETLAAEIGWPFIELGVADFLSKGIDHVFERSTEIFEDLLILREAVVLLDEVESVFADRRQKEVELLQKFLTAALLPPLQRIKKRGKIVLVIATNHISSFDSAISRPGRIDFIIPVGPPDRPQRARILQEQVKLDEETASALAALLPDSVTLLEVILFAKLPKPVVSAAGVEEAEKYEAAWKATKPTLVIDDDTMNKFRDDSARYRRIS